MPGRAGRGCNPCASGRYGFYPLASAHRETVPGPASGARLFRRLRRNGKRCRRPRAAAHVLALQRLLKRENPANFEVFNLGAGRGSSVLEVIQSFEQVTGETLNYRIAPRRAGDVPEAWADTRKANAALGWQARFSLDEAVQSAWAWEKKIDNKARAAIGKAEGENETGTETHGDHQPGCAERPREQHAGRD